MTFLSCRDRCARGQRHVSLYLAARLGGKGKMIYVPRELEEKARRRLDDGREAARLLEIVCEASLEVFLKERKTRRSGREG